MALYRNSVSHFFLLELTCMTGKRGCIDEAEVLAKEEICDLSQINSPDWWRMPERSDFIMALHQLLKMRKGSENEAN